MRVNKLRRIAEVLSDNPSGEIRPVSGRDDPRFENRSFPSTCPITCSLRPAFTPSQSEIAITEFKTPESRGK